MDACVGPTGWVQLSGLMPDTKKEVVAEKGGWMGDCVAPFQMESQFNYMQFIDQSKAL